MLCCSAARTSVSFRFASAASFRTVHYRLCLSHFIFFFCCRIAMPHNRSNTTGNTTTLRTSGLHIHQRNVIQQNIICSRLMVCIVPHTKSAMNSKWVDGLCVCLFSSLLSTHIVFSVSCITCNRRHGSNSASMRDTLVQSLFQIVHIMSACATPRMPAQKV